MSWTIANAKALKETARHMERELNLMRRDSLELGLDRANVWAEFVDWNRLMSMAEIWRPLEIRMRDLLTQIRQAEPESVDTLRTSLVTALQELETKIRPLNADAISEMAEKLKKLP